MSIFIKKMFFHHFRKSIERNYCHQTFLPLPVIKPQSSSPQSVTILTELPRLLQNCSVPQNTLVNTALEHAFFTVSGVGFAGGNGNKG
jgi:hypothetical protein